MFGSVKTNSLKTNSMKFLQSNTSKKADVLFLSLFENEKLSSDLHKILGDNNTKTLNERIKAKDFQGKSGDVLTLFPEDKKFKKIIVLGRGKKSEPGIQSVEKFGALIAKTAKKAKVKTANIVCEEDEARDILNGIILGEYEFEGYKKKDKDATKLESINLVCKSGNKVRIALHEAEIFQSAAKLTRDLINTPAGDMTSIDIAKKAHELAKEFKLKINIFDEKKLKTMGCGALLGVGRGAENPPKMIVLEYKHKSKSTHPNVAFVGKGITFDTGGLNLKPTGYIETMKQDMAGAATVLGTCHAIAKAKLSGYFVFVLAVAENAISEKATRPGDVLKAFNGKTIEVTNTDAEGRLVLADALSYTEQKLKPRVMLNIATLTGAVSVALGYNITGVMGNDKKLMNEVLDAAESSNERVWQLPLDDDFVKETKGSFTDIKNSTDGVRAGSSMGAAFLKNFVDKVKWVHFDIGGTAWAEKPEIRTSYGATAVMLRTFLEMAKRHAS